MLKVELEVHPTQESLYYLLKLRELPQMSLSYPIFTGSCLFCHHGFIASFVLLFFASSLVNDIHFVILF